MHAPTTSATPSTHEAPPLPAPRGVPGAVSRIAFAGGVVAFAASIFGSYLHYLSERDTDEYAGLVIILGVVVGAIAIAPGALLAAVSARTLAWRSTRAMWIAGTIAAAVGPLLLWLYAWIH